MRKVYLLLLLSFISFYAGAQRMMGVSTNNWNATSALYLDPALIADSRTSLTFDILSFNVFADNDLGSISKTKLGDRLGAGKYPGLNNILDMGTRQTGNVIAPYGEVRGPGVLWNPDHKNSFAITTRLRDGSQFTGIDQQLFQSVQDADYGKNNGSYSRNVNFRWNNAAWGEVGLSWARVLVDNGRNFLSAGVTLRYLGGITYSSMKVNNATVDYYAAKDSTRFTNTDLVYSSSTLNDKKAVNARTPVMQLLGAFFGRGGGSGVGADLGVSYEYRPDYEKYKYDMDGEKGITDHSRPRYKLRLSAAVTDIGAIAFYGADRRQVTVTGSGYTIANDISKNVYNYNDFRKFTRVHGFKTDTSVTGAVYHLPTALVLGADYLLGGKFYVNATAMANLASHDAIGMYYPGQITITPRYDNRTFSIGVPLTYSAYSHSFKMGAGVCMAGFFIGSDDMLVLMSDHQSGFNFYMGGFVPVNYKKLADRDGDQVSDKKDQCPDVAGLWDFHGCPNPDKDKDGIPDSLDACPSMPGVRSARGCPDKDGDGVADNTDRCPTEPGTKALKGCPDRDGDGIADIDDACPDKKGTSELKGCPDADGDGIPDNLDKCPDVAGTAANNGCPVEAKPQKIIPADKEVTGLTFETGKAIIQPSSYPLLQQVVATMKEYPDYYLDIEGYTDNTGTDKQNEVLSVSRALVVKKWFAGHGVPAGKIEIHGKGSADPLGDNSKAEGRAMNRRVKMILKYR